MKPRLLTAIILFLIPFISFSQAGTLDSSFGVNGKVVTDFNSSDDYAYATAIQADGKIVVGGVSQLSYALVRYNTNGSLDSTFGENGKVLTDFDSSNNWGIHSILIQSDGKIIALGSVGSSFYLDFF